MISMALFSTMSLSIANQTSKADEDKSSAITADEKCAGIVMKGKGDGKVKRNGLELEWIYVPAGACAKISGSKIIYD